MTTALASFGQQSGQQITADGNLVRNLSTSGVQGRMTPTEALTRLLAGTGLTHTSNGGTIVLQRIASHASDGTTINLPPVQIEGQSAEYGPGQGMAAETSTAGTKTDTPLIETPQSISVITRKQLDQQNFQTAAQSLQYAPGVSTGTRGGYDPRFDYANVRGFNESTQGDYRDGLRQNAGVGSSFSFFGVEPYGLDRIDIVRGPSSVLYGLNAPGGLIDRISKRPTEQPFHEMQINLGSDNWYQGQFDLSGPATPSGNVLYRMTGLVRDADAPFPRTKDNRTFLAPAVIIKIDPDTTLTFLSNYEKDQTGVGTVARNVAGQLTKVYLDDPSFSHYHRDQAQVGYQFEHRFDGVFTLRQNFGYGYLDTNYNSLNQLSASGDSVSRYQELVQEGLRTYSVDTQLQAKFVTGPVSHTAIVGFHYFRSTLRQKIGYGLAPSLDLQNPQYGIAIPAPTTSLADANQAIDQYGLYVQDQMKWKHLILVLSGRQDWAKSHRDSYLTATQTTVSDSAQTGRAGLLYESDIGLSPYVSVATSFQPNLGTDAAGQGFTPTTGTQEEVGLKYQPPGMGSFAAISLFNIDEHNVLVTDTVHTGFQTQTGAIRSRGVELEARADLGLGLSLIGTYTYNDVRNTQSSPANTVGKMPTGTPDQFGSAWLNYTFQTGDLTGFGFGGGVRYTGPTFADAANTIGNPATFYLDMEAHYDLGKWRLQVNGSNLTGRRVATCSGTVCTMNEDRFVLASLRYSW